MSESQDQFSNEVTTFEFSGPVPAARSMGDFCMEQIGDEIVLFDSELNRYHNLNIIAFDIWRNCDGVSSGDQIAATVAASRPEIRREAVESAIVQLGESGLLQAPEGNFESTMHRRKIMKLVAAGAIGAVGIPIVASITRLGPEASATPPCNCAKHADCNGSNKPCGTGGGDCVNCVCKCK